MTAPRFVGLVPEALQQLADTHRLTVTERWVLVVLLLHADYKTGLWRGTQGDLGELVGLDRRNLRSKLDSLAETGTVDVYFPRGYAGIVRLNHFLDLVHLTPTERTKHPLHAGRRKGRLGDLREEWRKGRNVPSGGTNRPLRALETAGHEIAPSLSVEAPASGETTARRNGPQPGARAALTAVVHEPPATHPTSPRCIPSGVRVEVAANGSDEPSPGGHEREPRARGTR